MRQQLSRSRVVATAGCEHADRPWAGVRALGGRLGGLAGGLIASLACIVALQGCGESLAGRPPLGKVSGKVTYKGNPVTSGTVTFTPIQGQGAEGGHIATGAIRSDGSYSLTTFDTDDGAVLGQHAATVIVREGGADLQSLNTNDGADLSRPATMKPRYMMPKPTSPPIYASPSTTPLKYTVREGQNTFDLELRD